MRARAIVLGEFQHGVLHYIQCSLGIADSKKRELVCPALDFNQKIRQFVTGSQELSFL